MKNTPSLLLLLSILVICSCGKDDTTVEEPIQSRFNYPVVFNYSGFDLNPTEYYTYNNDGFNLIEASPDFAAMVDSILYTEVFYPADDDAVGFKEIKLLSDSTTSIRIDSGDPSEPDINTTLSSYIDLDTLVVLIDPAYDLVLKLNIAKNEDRLSVCTYSLSLLYFDSSIGRRTDTGFDLDDCKARDKVAIMEDFVGNSWVSDNIAYGDTIILNVSEVVFDRE